MRPSRSFRPSALLLLEDRVVLTATSAQPLALSAVEAALQRKAATLQLSPAEIAQSNASDVPFGFDPDETLQSGYPVAEQVMTTYIGGATQTESLLKVPDLSNNSVTTYKTINLRNNGGTETVVDTETFSGGAVPLSGTNNTHTITTTLPNGTIQTETDHEVITGNKTVINATVDEAGGGVETWTSINIKHGPKTVANKTIVEPDDTIEHQRTVTTHQGKLDSTARTTTTQPGQVQVSASATNVIRVQPPSS